MSTLKNIPDREEVAPVVAALAMMLSEYFDYLIKEGFTRQEALTIAVEFQAHMLSAKERGGLDSFLSDQGQ